MLVQEGSDVIPLGLEWQRSERTDQRCGGRQRRILVGRHRLLMAGDGDDTRGPPRKHRTLTPQVVEIWVWVGDQFSITEVIHRLECLHDFLSNQQAGEWAAKFAIADELKFDVNTRKGLCCNIMR